MDSYIRESMFLKANGRPNDIDFIVKASSEINNSKEGLRVETKKLIVKVIAQAYYDYSDICYGNGEIIMPIYRDRIKEFLPADTRNLKRYLNRIVSVLNLRGIRTVVYKSYVHRSIISGFQCYDESNCILESDNYVGIDPKSDTIFLSTFKVKGFKYRPLRTSDKSTFKVATGAQCTLGPGIEDIVWADKKSKKKFLEGFVLCTESWCKRKLVVPLADIEMLCPKVRPYDGYRTSPYILVSKEGESALYRFESPEFGSRLIPVYGTSPTIEIYEEGLELFQPGYVENK